MNTQGKTAAGKDPSYDPSHPEECCPSCGARQERGDDGYCNRCGKSWPEKMSADRSAVIVRGNPKYTENNSQADKFYAAIHRILKQRGYSTSDDPGEPETMPPAADLWVGHSRGTDRFRFAPEGQKTLSFGSTVGINHPKDKAMEEGQVPDRYHFTVTRQMRDALKTAGFDVPDKYMDTATKPLQMYWDRVQQPLMSAGANLLAGKAQPLEHTMRAFDDPGEFIGTYGAVPAASALAGGAIGAALDKKHRVHGAIRGGLTGAGLGTGQMLSMLMPESNNISRLLKFYGVPLAGAAAGYALGGAVPKSKEANFMPEQKLFKPKKPKPMLEDDDALGNTALGVGAAGLGTALGASAIQHVVGPETDKNLKAFASLNKEPGYGQNPTQDFRNYIQRGSAAADSKFLGGIPLKHVVPWVRQSIVRDPSLKNIPYSRVYNHYDQFSHGPLSADVTFHDEFAPGSVNNLQQMTDRYAREVGGSPTGVSGLNQQQQQKLYPGFHDWLNKNYPEAAQAKNTSDANLGKTTGYATSQYGGAIATMNRIRSGAGKLVMPALGVGGLGLGAYALIQYYRNQAKKKKEQQQQVPSTGVIDPAKIYA